VINTSKFPSCASVATVGVAPAKSARYLRSFGSLILATLRGTYEARTEKSLMRLAPTRPAHVTADLDQPGYFCS
jgi:hypothetical protein